MVDEAVVKHIAKEYDSNIGATSLKDCIEEEIENEINELEYTVGHFKLIGNPRDEENEFQCPG